RRGGAARRHVRTRVFPHLEPAEDCEGLAMSVVYRRSKNASARRVGSATFLANAERGTLYRVSSSMAALWTLLERPMGAPEAVEVFQAAFPSMPLRPLRAHVATMLRDLVSEGIIERANIGRAK